MIGREALLELAATEITGDDLHDQIVKQLLKYIDGSDDAFGMYVSEIMVDLEQREMSIRDAVYLYAQELRRKIKSMGITGAVKWARK